MHTQRNDWWSDEGGESTIGYALILGLIGFVAAGGILVLGKLSNGTFVTVSATTNDNSQKPPASLASSQSSGLQPTVASPTVPATPSGALHDPFDGTGDLTWTFARGTWLQKRGVLTTQSQWAFATAEIPWSDYSYTVDMQTLSAGPEIWDVTRAVFRFQDPNNYYAIVPKTDGAIELAKMQNGVWRPWLAYAQTGLDPRQMHTYRVDVVGNQISVWADGKQYMSYTDANPIARGGVGAVNETSAGTIDNVSVKQK